MNSAANGYTFLLLAHINVTTPPVQLHAAEYDDLPEQVKVEVQRFADVNIEWLQRPLIAAGTADPTTVASP